MLNTIYLAIKRDIVVTVHVGRIRHFLQNWRLITQDPWVLQVDRGSASSNTNTNSNLASRGFFSIQSEETDHRAGRGAKLQRAINPACQAPGGFVSQLFLVPKKDGG